MAHAELEPTPIHYPESDGKPAAETDIHRDLMLDLIASAAYHFRGERDVYVSGNLLLYYEELTSRSTLIEDHGTKKAVYEQIGVEEYFIFDPEAPWSPSLLRAHRRQDGELLPVKDVREAAGKLIASSKTLGLELWAEAGSLRWVEPKGGKALPVPTDFLEAAEKEMKRAEAERARADAVEARAEAERQRAEAEKKRADAAEAEVRRLREAQKRGKGRK